MDKKATEQMGEVGKSVLDAMFRLQEINDRTLQRLAQHQFAAAGDYMSTGVKQLKVMNDTKDAKDVLAKQVELASELSEKMMGHAQQAIDVIAQSKKELNELVEKSLHQFMSMAKE